MFLRELHPKRLLLDTWRDIDSERAAEPPSDAPDRAPAVALVVAAMCLVAMEYWGNPANILRVFGSHDALWGEGGLYASGWLRLSELAWWALWRVLGFFIVPALAARWLLGLSLRDCGLTAPGLREHRTLYGALLLAALPLVGLASLSEDFVRYYPFYRQAGRSWLDLLLWEALYVAQFFALEYFFRGFLLTACRRSMGSAAIFVSMVPYCMIHFTKPLPEVFAAIGAGVVLGTVAMRTRSIWGGLMLHTAVALAMDGAALAQTSGFPGKALP